MEKLNNLNTLILPLHHRTINHCTFAEPFKCCDKNTAVPDRSIPLNTLFQKFLKNESIIMPGMSKATFNVVPDNPYTRKGFDLADRQDAMLETLNRTNSANSALKDELEKQKASQLPPSPPSSKEE